MSHHSDLVYVQHILKAIDRMEEYTRNLTEEAFVANSLVQDAVVRQFEVIGEAAKKVSPEFRQQYPAIPWSFMAKMRDILIHHYWDVDLDVVWVTLRRDIPGLLPLLKATLG
ncbi:MAG TPA: DUF86 domain-containing protein [Symbiobacteriaceae bacterium]|nr:DUF86 domain-containing protein [Symbiobacteriaceae bacterium]